mgnify:CR=1 FL=1
MSNVTVSQPVKKQSGVSRFFKKLLLEYNTILMLIILVIISSCISDKFFTAGNIINLLRQNVALGVIAMGMLFVILTGGIDLSVGSIAAVGSVMVATFLATSGFNVVVAIILTILIGLALGLVSGVLVAYAKMAPFIATLAMMTIARGIAYIVSNGSPISTPTGTLNVIGTASAGPIPALIIFAIVVVVLFFLILRFTSFGRIVVATGSNEKAVQLAGIRVNTYKLAVYGISGICSALGGIVIATRTYIGSPIVGEGMELDAIAAVVIGGASLNGGKGYVFRTIVGVIILGLITNIMNLAGVPPYPQEVIKGLIIIGAVFLQGITDKSR